MMGRRRVGDLLVEWGAITPSDLADALAAQKASDPRERLGKILLARRLIDETQLAQALGEVHGLATVDLNHVQVNETIARRLPRSVTERFNILPIEQDGDTITVAIADPVDVVALDEMKSRLGSVRIRTVVAPESQIRTALSHVWGDAEQSEVVEQFVEELPEEEIPDDDDSDVGAVKIVNQILATAARRNASDIHVEPLAHAVRVRIRVDGILREMLRLPASSHASIATRMKIIAGLQVMERRKPQDGRTTVRIEKVRRDVRVSTLPTIHGEKIVLRLLPTQQELPGLEDLGLTPAQATELHEAMQLPQGFLLVTGPTGAGKSNTLYSAISGGVDDERNVVTLEDPVEMELTGINQVQVNPVVGLTFDAVLRSALRQDPDVVMVGEIRDLETGHLAVRAALTGHLVLSTLHTLDAPSSIRRLLEMGIPDYLLASSLTLVIAQRLLRRPCRLCLAPKAPSEQVQTWLGLSKTQAAEMVAGKGCQVCDYTGYRGRIGVFELLLVNDDMRSAILNNADDAALKQVARAGGWIPMVERGVELAMAHLTTPDEIIRTLGHRTPGR